MSNESELFQQREQAASGCLIIEGGAIEVAAAAAQNSPAYTLLAGNGLSAGYLIVSWKGHSHIAAARFANGLKGQIVRYPKAVTTESNGDIA